jgi:tRNA(adenine34) deaminase
MKLIFSFFCFFFLIAFQLPCFAAIQSDEYYMQRAFELASHHLKAPFAAVIVDNKTGKILAEGVNTSSVNPTYHGEMVAINNFAKKYPHGNWQQVTLYTTAEPCSMCQSAIVWSGIPRVVFATSMDFLLHHGWDQIDIHASDINAKSPFYHGTIKGGVLSEKTDKLFNRP